MKEETPCIGDRLNLLAVADMLMTFFLVIVGWRFDWPR